MAVQTLHLEHVPRQYPIHIALFKDVENCALLKQQLLSGNEEFEYAFIDASVVCLWRPLLSGSPAPRLILL
jgi:EKC/KEOPS complex subunit CGI121/TPRKB